MADIQVPYSEAGLASFEGLDTYLASFLIAGEHPKLASYPMVVTALQALQQFQVVGLAAGKLVPATYLGALGGDESDVAVQTMVFTTPPDVDDTFTIGSTVYTWKATPGATANHVKTGASNTLAADAMVAAINDEGDPLLYGTATVENPDVYAVKVDANTVTIYAKVPGAAGNAIATTQTGDESVWGAATMTGGEGLTAGPIGVVTQAVTGNAEGTTSVPVFYSGHFNIDALVWDASFDTDDKKLSAFNGAPSPTQIQMRKRG